MIDGPFGIQEFKQVFSLKETGLTDEEISQYRAVSVPKLGRPVKTVRPSLSFFFRSNLTIIEPTIGGSMFMRSPADLSFLNRTMMKLWNSIKKSNAETGLIEAEHDNAKKSMLLTSSTGSKHIEVAGLVNNSDSFPESIKLLSEYFPLSKSDRLQTPISLTTTRGTNHGWPTFMPGSDSRNSVDLLVHIELAKILMDQFNGDLIPFEEYVRKLTGVPEPMASSMFFRRQPTSKWTYEFALTTSGPLFRSASQGKFCRQRQVFGVPLFINTALRSLAQYVRTVYKRHPTFNHTTPTNTLNYLRTFKDFTFFSEDLSGYDKSVSVGCQKALLDSFYGIVASDAERALYSSLSTLSVLSPPLTSDSNAFLYRREGQTISGSIFTDKDGSLINFGRIADCVAAANNWSLGKTRRQFGRDWMCLILGDDCVIGYRKSLDFDRTRYNDKSNSLGFKTEAFEGAVFLMNYFDIANNKWFGIASRALDRTFNKEYAVDDAVIDLFGTYNRLVRVVDSPFGDDVIESVIRRDVVKSKGITTFKELEKFAQSERTLDYIVKYGEQAGKQAKIRDMLAGLTHGSLNMDDISNSVFTLTQLDYIESMLAGVTVDDESLRSEVRMPEDIFKYITSLINLNKN